MVLRSQKMISNLFLWVPHFQTNPNPKMGCPQGCTIRIHLRGQEEFLVRRFDPQCLLAKNHCDIPAGNQRWLAGKPTSYRWFSRFPSGPPCFIPTSPWVQPRRRAFLNSTASTAAVSIQKLSEVVQRRGRGSGELRPGFGRRGWRFSPENIWLGNGKPPNEIEVHSWEHHQTKSGFSGKPCLSSKG